VSFKVNIFCQGNAEIDVFKFFLFMIIGEKGFVAWFEAVVYNKMVEASKVLGVRILLHGIGVIVLMLGLYVFIAAMPSFASIAGLLLSFLGMVIFIVPFGARK